MNLYCIQPEMSVLSFGFLHMLHVVHLVQCILGQLDNQLDYIRLMMVKLGGLEVNAFHPGGQFHGLIP